MSNPYDLILEELNNRKVAFVEKFAPFYICSIGCHIFNLYNRNSKVLVEAGRVCDTRLHLMFVAPPGFSKTFFLEQFARGDHAILKDSGVETDFEGFMSEAGFVGTVKLIDSTPVLTEGIAQLYCDAIVAVEEFSAIAGAMRQEHSSTLDPALLGALDSGWVYKRLAHGEIKYQTSLTLWAATQPARFDLTSGLGRRLFFLLFIPGVGDVDCIRKARRVSKGIRFDMYRTTTIRTMIRSLISDVNMIENVTFSDEFFKLLDELRVPHYEEILFERLSLGYHLMKYGVKKEFVITVDEELKRLMKLAVKWRLELKHGSEYAEVMAVILDRGGALTEAELKRELMYFGLDWKQSSQLINEMLMYKLLVRVGDRLYVAGESK